MTSIESIAVLGYEGCSEQDTITPLEIFKAAAQVAAGNIAPWQREVPPVKVDVKLVTTTPGVITMTMGTQAIPDLVLSDDDKYDILYIPGGIGSGAVATDERVLNVVRRHHAAGKVLAANCSAVGVLARAEILGNAPVTCVAAVARRLRAEGINVPPARRMWIGNPAARIWTSAGAYSVHGGTAAMISHYFGREIGTIVSMAYDALAGIGDYVHELVGPEFYQHAELESAYQDYFEDTLLPKRGTAE